MNFLSDLWLSSAAFFNPIQNSLNGNFWHVFEEKFAEFANGKLVLDLACGTGELRKHINPRNYLGIDLNIFYINYARKRFKEKNSRFKSSNILKFTHKDKYNTVFLVSAAHHLSDSELRILFNNLKKCIFHNLVIIDGVPKGLFSPLLRFMDAYFGGGKYFRSTNQLLRIVREYFKITKHGNFSASGSFYTYPYIIAAR